jgi:hypothetical protein
VYARPPYTKLSEFFAALAADGWRVDLLDEVEITIEGIQKPMDGIQFTITRGTHGEHRTAWVKPN